MFSLACELGREAGTAIPARLETGAFPCRSKSLPVRFKPNRSSAG